MRLPPDLTETLANPTWGALVGAPGEIAEGSGKARRYHPDVSVFHALADHSPEAWEAAATLVNTEGAVLLTGAVATVTDGAPAGWEHAWAGQGYQMVLTTPPDDVTVRPLPAIDAETGTAVRLRPLAVDDVPAMMALVALAEPGPFRPRTIELGGYVGIFHDDELVAMAGQRFHPPGACEISAVCTHPDARRRGYASILTRRVAEGIAARGELAFLHVAEHNTSARLAYEALGFHHHQRATFAMLRLR